MTATDYTPPVYSDEVNAKLTARKEEAAAKGWYEIDSRLAAFLHLIFGTEMQHDDGTADLIVVVDGQVISGTMVSEAAWAKLQADSIRETSAGAAEGLDLMQELTAEHRATAVEQAAENPLIMKQARYIHFRAPRVHNHGGIPMTFGPTRIDLRKVSAWSLGSLNYNS
jgi:hypothetical protein